MLDFSGVERQSLARVTQDAGNHVAIEVHPAATLSIPVKILFLADVFGTPGRAAVEERLPGAAGGARVDFCVVNAENAADGAGSRRGWPTGCSPRAPT